MPEIPTSPGVYLFKDKSRKIIYIGKAKNLRKRVKSYFQKKHHDQKTENLVSGIDTTDFIVTDNEVEALLLESNLIKLHLPKYNINLRHSERYAFLQITNEHFPRLVTARDTRSKGKYFGPFVSAQERDYIRQLLNRTFRLRTCKRMPKRACIRFHIGLCEAPCTGNITEIGYDELVSKASQVLKGKTKGLIKKLKKDLLIESKKTNYERAIQLRNELYALEALQDKQKVERLRKHDEDIINYVVRDGKVYLILFNIYKGMLARKHEFSFGYNDDFLEEFIVQYYSQNPVPKELILPQTVNNSIQEYLEKKKSQNVMVTIPKKADKKKLLELVMKNIELTFFGEMKKLTELQKRLKLHAIPSVIECFDISHLGGTSTVGSMVQFRNGLPDKSNYRRFKVRTVKGIDDTASIAEVVWRRYKRLKSEKLEMPDLILIDGGKGQLSAAMTQLKKINLKIPMISIAKKFEEIYFPGSKFPLRLKPKSKALLFVREIRDEAHRFAINYSRLLGKKKLVG